VNENGTCPEIPVRSSYRISRSSISKFGSIVSISGYHVTCQKQLSGSTSKSMEQTGENEKVKT
jgi:hypothetical protein